MQKQQLPSVNAKGRSGERAFWGNRVQIQVEVNEIWKQSVGPPWNKNGLGKKDFGIERIIFFLHRFGLQMCVHVCVCECAHVSMCFVCVFNNRRPEIFSLLSSPKTTNLYMVFQRFICILTNRVKKWFYDCWQNLAYF